MTYRSLLRIIGLFSLTLVFFVDRALATHIRAGEIVAIRTSNSTLTYKFTVIGYTDTGSSVVFGGGDIDFGDGTVVNLTESADNSGSITLNGEDEVAYNFFEITHTFSAPGKYTVRYNERNRNAGVQNMSNSVDTPFYIETSILIDPFVGLNNTPEFLVPPIDKGAVGAAFIHNPGAYDSDGDSLSYRITTPKQSFDREVNNYLSPVDPEFYDGNYLTGNENQDDIPVFEIDEITGNLLWDAPGSPGEYNVAFIVDEWRKIENEWFLLGSLVRDMQIIIEDTDNERPEITPPPDLCVEAGTAINEIITASDPDGHQVKIEAFGGPFEQETNSATINPDGSEFQDSPATATFDWQTSCELVRSRPYEVQLKATDNPELGPKLVDFKTWNITVVAPAPTGLTAAVRPGRSIRLNWDSYAGCVGASEIQIWRRVDSYNFEADECNVGLPESAGYELIDMVDADLTEYLDDNNGNRLAPGAEYCYRIVAVFPDPAGGESYASTEACAEMGLNAPIIVEVDVEDTDEESGQIFIKWQLPQDLGLDDYLYELVRFEGQGGLTNPDTIATDIARITGVDFLTYVDDNIDTKQNAYHYVVNLIFIDNGEIVDWSAPASTVWIETSSTTEEIQLNWESLTPWSNIVQPEVGDDPEKYYHEIYRYKDDGFIPEEDLTIGDFELLATVDAPVTGLSYNDKSEEGNVLDPNHVYYYYVETKGSYGNDLIEDPIINKSQFNSAQLDDGVAPNCTPQLTFDEDFDCTAFLAGQNCIFSDFFRDLNWSYDFDNCDNDVKAYRIYFSEDGSEEGFGEIGTDYVAEVQGTSYRHTDLTSFKGCYRITAVDKAGNEGEWDEEQTLCADNCPNYLLPNAFSPNNDPQMKNETFTPYNDRVNNQVVANFDNSKCPRFVSKVKFKVFDRSGGLIYDYDSDGPIGEGQINGGGGILINWSGVTNSGRELPPGVYYYGAEVTFDVLNEEESQQTIKGWVQIMK